MLIGCSDRMSEAGLDLGCGWIRRPGERRSIYGQGRQWEKMSSFTVSDLDC